MKNLKSNGRRIGLFIPVCLVLFIGGYFYLMARDEMDAPSRLKRQLTGSPAQFAALKQRARSVLGKHISDQSFWEEARLPQDDATALGLKCDPHPQYDKDMKVAAVGYRDSFNIGGYECGIFISTDNNPDIRNYGGKSSWTKTQWDECTWFYSHSH